MSKTLFAVYDTETAAEASTKAWSLTKEALPA